MLSFSLDTDLDTTSSRVCFCPVFRTALLSGRGETYSKRLELYLLLSGVQKFAYLMAVGATVNESGATKDFASGLCASLRDQRADKSIVDTSKDSVHTEHSYNLFAATFASNDMLALQVSATRPWSDTSHARCFSMFVLAQWPNVFSELC